MNTKFPRKVIFLSLKTRKQKNKKHSAKETVLAKLWTYTTHITGLHQSHSMSVTYLKLNNQYQVILELKIHYVSKNYSHIIFSNNFKYDSTSVIFGTDNNQKQSSCM